MKKKWERLLWLQSFTFFLTEYFATRTTRAVVAGKRVGESLGLSVDQ